MLLFRLSGVFLFRLAERVFLALLFHEPPRKTRRFDRSPNEDDITQQSPKVLLPVGKPRMADPGSYTLCEFRNG